MKFFTSTKTFFVHYHGIIVCVMLLSLTQSHLQPLKKMSAYLLNCVLFSESISSMYRNVIVKNFVFRQDIMYKVSHMQIKKKSNSEEYPSKFSYTGWLFVEKSKKYIINKNYQSFWSQLVTELFLFECVSFFPLTIYLYLLSNLQLCAMKTYRPPS